MEFLSPFILTNIFLYYLGVFVSRPRKRGESQSNNLSRSWGVILDPIEVLRLSVLTVLFIVTIYNIFMYFI
jgi:hypothetical protein